MADRYVQVDEETKLILDGPFLWDGQTQLDFGPGTTMLESKAREQGFAWPPPPDPDPDPDPDPEPEPEPDPLT